jgi:chemotaxis signal transduction protein
METLEVLAPESASRRLSPDESVLASTAARIPGVRELALFRLGNNWFGVDLGQIELVVPLNYATWVTLDHGLILGAVGLHGRLFPVVDLEAILGCGSGSLHDHVAILVIHAGTAEVGILADEFDDVLMVPDSQAAETGAGSPTQFHSGRYACGHRTVTVIDPQRIVESLHGHSAASAPCG